MTDLYADVERGVQDGGGGGETPYIPEYFQSEKGPYCCGYKMPVREVQATAFSRTGAFAAKHVVKTCRGECGKTWYLNKKMYTEKLGEDDVTTHTFYRWTAGVPAWISTKSGKVIISTDLLTDFSIAQSTLR